MSVEKLPKVVANVTTHFRSTYNTNKNVEVEVLTVHFKTGKMRVRYIPEDYYGSKDKNYTCDISNKPFLDKYWK